MTHTAEARLAAFARRFGWPERLAPAAPLAIAHRGASDHAPENSLKAFALAHDLGAEMWEIDVRVSADGVPVVIHDADLERLAGNPARIHETGAAELRGARLEEGERLPVLDEVIALARRTGCGLYVELKDERAGPLVVDRLAAHDFRFAAIGSFVPEWIGALRKDACPWPLSILVPRGADALSHGADVRPDIVHPCWEAAAERPDRLLTPELLARLHDRGAEVVAWHEERPPVIAALRRLPLLGICSNRPELLKPWRGEGPAVVCHRGANALAPENTLAAARLSFEQGFDYVELDVRQTADGALVVMHDADVARTTDGQGLVCEMTGAEIRRLDAGGWFAPRFRGERVPLLAEMLALARNMGRQLYIEIKNADPRRVIDEVIAHDMLASCFFWSFDQAVLDGIRAAAAQARIMAPRWMYPSLEEAVRRHGAEIVEFDDTRDDLSEIAECRRLGVKSMVFSLSDDPARLARHAALRPDLVNLDRPHLMALALDHPGNPRLRSAFRRGGVAEPGAAP